MQGGTESVPADPRGALRRDEHSVNAASSTQERTGEAGAACLESWHLGKGEMDRFLSPGRSQARTKPLHYLKALEETWTPDSKAACPLMATQCSAIAGKTSVTIEGGNSFLIQVV